jgi:transcriptional regulator with XRE-family HTH domain
VKKLLNGKVDSPAALGQLIRQHRKAQTITLNELASLCGVGARFLSELENGKSTAQSGKIFQVLNCLGLEMVIHTRGWIDSDIPDNARKS